MAWPWLNQSPQVGSTGKIRAFLAMIMALKPTIAVPAGLGVVLILLDLLALEANGLWLLGVFMVVFSAFRFHMQRLDAAREEAEQKEFEQELLAQKKRRKSAAALEMQQEKLRRDLEHEQELGKLNRRRP